MRSRTFWICAVACLLLFGYKYASLNFFGPSDQQLIQQAMDQAIQATREGRPGGVLELLSAQFKVNSQETSSGQVAKFIKESHPEVSVPETKAFITGDSARLTAPTHVKGNFLSYSFDKTINNVAFLFQREDAHDWLIVPYKKWRLVQIIVPDASLPEAYGWPQW